MHPVYNYNGDRRSPGLSGATGRSARTGRPSSSRTPPPASAEGLAAITESASALKLRLIVNLCIVFFFFENEVLSTGNGFFKMQRSCAAERARAERKGLAWLIAPITFPVFEDEYKQKMNITIILVDHARSFHSSLLLFSMETWRLSFTAQRRYQKRLACKGCGVGSPAGCPLVCSAGSASGFGGRASGGTRAGRHC